MKTTTSFQNRLDNSSGIGQDNSNGTMQTASETKKTPWHLRFAPGAILRKSGIIAVLAVVTLLVQAPVEQAQAADSPTPEIAPAGLSNYDVILRHLLVPATPPAAVIKKAVLHVGTYLVCAVGEWYIGKTLDSLTQAEIDKAAGQSATCGIEWVKWEENSHEKTTYTAPWFARAISGGGSSGGTYTRSARQGRQDTTASGTWEDGSAMTGADAFYYLRHARTSTVRCTYEIINSNNRRRHLSFKAREDSLNSMKAKAIQDERARTGDSSWRYGRLGRKQTFKSNVGSYGINSDFDDPFPVYEKLAEPGSDEKARSYEVTATWIMCPIKPNARCGTTRPMRKVWKKGKRDSKGDYYFPSYKDNYVPFDFCESNESIANIQCDDSVTRKIVDRDITEIKHVWMIVDTVSDILGTLPVYGWRLVETKIGTERVVVLDEN